MTKVVHLSYSDIAGGAAIAAYRLHSALRADGVESRMLVFRKSSGEPTVKQLEAPKRLWHRVCRGLRRCAARRTFNQVVKSRTKHAEVFNAQRSPFRGQLRSLLATADVVHAHWIAGFMDVETLAEISGDIPVIWTLHDMNPLTGGCHYDFGCGRYVQSCGRCPQLQSEREDDITAQRMARNRAILDQDLARRLHLVSPSHWLGDCVRASSLFRACKSSVIHNGLNMAVFRPRDRAMARSLLDVPASAKVVVTIGQERTSFRKGSALLVEALKLLKDVDGLFLLEVGTSSRPLDLSIPYKWIAPTQDEALLSILYNSADVFVLPSLADNLPNTLVESVACGTPVVAYNTGGVSDIVQDDVSGKLVNDVSASALAKAISRLLDGNSESLRASARKLAETKFEIRQQCSKYRALYADVQRDSSS